jgi:uncharacterized protein
LIYYLDTSALVKAYVQETRSDEVLDLLRQAREGESSRRVFVSRLAYPEAASAIARRQRDGSIPAVDAQRLYRFLDADFTGPERPYEVIEPAPVVVNEAAALVRGHVLRGFDAVHLASALLLNQAAPGAVTFMAADRRLLAAARAEGLSVEDFSQ